MRMLYTPGEKGVGEVLKLVFATAHHLFLFPFSGRRA